MKESYSRRNFLKLSGLFTLGTLLTGCGISPEKISPTPNSQLSNIFKRYPELKEFSLNNILYQQESLYLPDRNIFFYNFSEYAIDSDQLTSLYTFFTQTLAQLENIPFSYSLNSSTTNIQFWLRSRVAKDTSFIIVPNDLITTSWSNATASSTDFGNIYISYVQLDDNNGLPLKSIFTEVCQTTRQAEATGINKQDATNNANLMQEIGCNSFAYALSAKSRGLTHDQYLTEINNILIGPNPSTSFSLWQMPDFLYDTLPPFNIIKN